MWPDPTQPISWLTQPNRTHYNRLAREVSPQTVHWHYITLQIEKFGPNPIATHAYHSILWIVPLETEYMREAMMQSVVHFASSEQRFAITVRWKWVVNFICGDDDDTTPGHQQHIVSPSSGQSTAAPSTQLIQFSGHAIIRRVDPPVDGLPIKYYTIAPGCMIHPASDLIHAISLHAL